MLRQIKPAMQRSQKGRRLTVEQGERIVVEVEMQEVEFLIVASLSNVFEHDHVQGVGIPHRSVQPQRFRPCRAELCRGLRIAAGEQRDVVPEGNELFGQPVNDPLSASIELRWHSLRQRSNLRNAHLIVSYL